MVFNATFNNISVLSWRSVLLVKETWVPLLNRNWFKEEILKSENNDNGFQAINNMKQARPWMLANLKIIWQFHAHPVHQKVSRFFGPRYIGDDFFLGPNLVSFNRTVVPYEISKVNFRVETKIVVIRITFALYVKKIFISWVC